MKTTDIRRQNLAYLLATQFKGVKNSLGAALGRQPGYVAAMLPGAAHPRSFGEANARDFEQRLGLPPGWLDTPHPEAADPTLEDGPPIIRPFRVARLLGTAQLGPDGYWDALGSADGYVDIPSSDPDTYALRVKGDSMTPAIRNNWVVWCEPSRTPVPGEYVMVRLASGECMVKELLYENEHEVSLMAVNDGYGRMTIPREQVVQLHHVGGIVAPSKIRY